MGRLVQAAKSGTRRETLEALRDKLAYAIETCKSGRDLAALSRQLTGVLAELEKLPDENKEETQFDALRNKVRGAQ